MFFSSQRVPSTGGPDGHDRDVGVAAEGALLEVAVVHSQVHEDRAQGLQVLDGLVDGADVGLAHDLEERDAGAVQVHARGAVGGHAVQALPGVLLHVDPGEANPPLGAVEREVDAAAQADGQLVLAHLVALGEVRVEVVLPREDALLLDGAAESEPGAHGELDHLPVERGEHARHGQADGADVGVGLGPEGGRAAAEDLAPGEELGVDLEADDELPVGESHPCYLTIRPEPPLGSGCTAYAAQRASEGKRETCAVTATALSR